MPAQAHPDELSNGWCCERPDPVVHTEPIRRYPNFSNRVSGMYYEVTDCENCGMELDRTVIA